MSHSIHFCLPESFRPVEFLNSPKLSRLGDDANYFVSLILTKTARRDVDERGFVRLKAEHLRRVMHKDLYNDVINALLDGGVIERVGYQPGVRCFGYKLAERYLLDKHVRQPARNERLIERLSLFYRQIELEHQRSMKPVHLALAQLQKSLTIDGEQALQTLRSLPPESNPWDVQGILVADIVNRNFHLKVGEFGRVSNNVTSMKRELRRSLRINSEPLHHVDIKCCQPALIGSLMRKDLGKRSVREGEASKNGTKASQPDDEKHKQLISIYDAGPLLHQTGGFERYCDLVQSGGFYELLLDELNAEAEIQLNREQIKKRFLADVIAKRKCNRRGDEYPSKVEDTFKRLFPYVYRYIRDVNKDGWEHANLIRRLQEEESRLVIEIVAADLIARHPDLIFITLHDAIYTTERGIPLVLDAFQRAFELTDYPMALDYPRTLKVAG